MSLCANLLLCFFLLLQKGCRSRNYFCLYTSANIKAYQYITWQTSTYPVNISWQTFLYPVYIFLSCLGDPFYRAIYIDPQAKRQANLPRTAFPTTTGLSTTWLEKTEVFPVSKAAQGVPQHLLSSATTPSWIHAQDTEDIDRVGGYLKQGC